MIHLVLGIYSKKGAFYLWGSLNIYVTSYFRLNGNPDLTVELASLMFPLIGLFLNGSLFIGIKAAEKLGIKFSMIYLVICIAASVFISSFMKNFWLFALFFGIFFGIFAGMCYMLPVHIGYMHFPNKKLINNIRGLVTGAIVAGFGCGVLISNNIVFNIIIGFGNNKSK